MIYRIAHSLDGFGADICLRLYSIDNELYHDARRFPNGPEIHFTIISSCDENPARLSSQGQAIDAGCMSGKLLCKTIISQDFFKVNYIHKEDRGAIENYCGSFPSP